MTYVVETLASNHDTLTTCEVEGQASMREVAVGLVRLLREKANAAENNPRWLKAEREARETIFRREIRMPSGLSIYVTIKQCPLHESYEENCADCFEEAVSGGIGWVLEHLPGVDADRMPDPAPFIAVFELSYEGDRLFPVTYRQGRDRDVDLVPENAPERIEEFIAAAQKRVTFWDEKVEAARAAEDPDAEHRALSARGEAGRQLDQIECWSVPTADGMTESRKGGGG